jgi:hypothetical protein
MHNTKVKFETGDKVMEPGRYFCKAGVSKEFGKGDSFPVCPISHRDTTWELMN